MPRFVLLPDATGVDLPGGRRLKVDRRHQINVDDRTAAAIRGSAAARRYDAILEVPSGRSLSSSTGYTHECGFAPWPWQTVCPNCGGPIPGGSM